MPHSNKRSQPAHHASQQSTFPRGVSGQVEGKAVSAEWMNENDLIRDPDFAYEGGKLFLGDCKGHEIGVADDRHVTTIAGSRAGKSSTALIPNLLRWQGSALVIDPKGELAEKTALWRSKALGQKVHVLDPFQITQFKSAEFNPFDELTDGKKDDIPDNAAVFAESMIINDKTGDHWSLSAKNLVRGLILHLTTSASLSVLRDHLVRCNDNDDRIGTGIFYDMVRNDAFDGIVSGIGHSMLAKGENEGASIISTAVEQTGFLDSPGLMRISQKSSFRLADLKRKRMTIYLVLPAGRMVTHYRWLRLIIDLALIAMERENTQPNPPVLFMLEEFPQLGHMRSLEAAAGLVAGFGVKLWTVLQDLSQLKNHYPKSWETFLGNAGIVQAFGNSDATTLEYLSKRLGDASYLDVQNVHVNASHMATGDSGRRENLRTVPLLAPFEIALHFSRSTNKQLILMPEHQPIALDRVHYSDPRFADAMEYAVPE